MGKVEIKYTYPTLEEVEKANHTQICTWYRFLGFTGGEDERKVMFKIVAKFKLGGGMTPIISKRIGWEQ